LSPEVRSHLSEDAQKTSIERYNAESDKTEEPTKAEHAAVIGWGVLANS